MRSMAGILLTFKHPLWVKYPLILIREDTSVYKEEFTFPKHETILISEMGDKS